MKPITRDALIAALAFGALGTAYTLQQAWNLQPCTMCIVQRYAFLVLGVAALWRMFFARRGSTPSWLAAQPAVLVGIAASTRIQLAISSPSLSCGRDKIASFLNGLPWVDWVPNTLEATGICGDPVPPVLGLPFHVWSAILFTAIGILVWSGAWRRALTRDVKA